MSCQTMLGDERHRQRAFVLGVDAGDMIRSVQPLRLADAFVRRAKVRKKSTLIQKNKKGHKNFFSLLKEKHRIQCVKASKCPQI